MKRDDAVRLAADTVLTYGDAMFMRECSFTNTATVIRTSPKGGLLVQDIDERTGRVLDDRSHWIPYHHVCRIRGSRRALYPAYRAAGRKAQAFALIAEFS